MDKAGSIPARSTVFDSEPFSNERERGKKSNRRISGHQSVSGLMQNGSEAYGTHGITVSHPGSRFESCTIHLVKRCGRPGFAQSYGGHADGYLPVSYWLGRQTWVRFPT